MFVWCIHHPDLLPRWKIFILHCLTSCSAPVIWSRTVHRSCDRSLTWDMYVFGALFFVEKHLKSSREQPECVNLWRTVSCRDLLNLNTTSDNWSFYWKVRSFVWFPHISFTLLTHDHQCLNDPTWKHKHTNKHMHKHKINAPTHNVTPLSCRERAGDNQDPPPSVSFYILLNYKLYPSPIHLLIYLIFLFIKLLMRPLHICLRSCL